MKRILALSLSAALLLALLCACGDPGAQNSADPTADPTGSPTQGTNPTQGTDPTKGPASETPVDLSTFIDKLGGAYELPMLMPYEDEFIQERFPGLGSLELSQCYYYAPMMTGVSTAEFVLIQVSSTADIDAVKSALQTRIDAQNSPTAMLYPHEQEDWANNARIVTNGSYVLMVVNSNCDLMVADFNAFLADPSYVPAPAPGSRSDDSVDDPNDEPGGVVPGLPGGGIVIPVPGGDAEPGNEPDGDAEPGGEPAVPGFGGVVLPGGFSGPGGAADPGTGTDETIVEPTGRTDADVDLEAFLWTVAEKYELPSLDLPPIDWVASDIPGLVSIPCVQRVVAQGMMTPPVCKIVLLQVTDSSDVQKVCGALQAYIDFKIETDAAYNVEDWRSASIEVQGNYIMMIAHSSHDSVAADFNALF